VERKDAGGHHRTRPTELCESHPDSARLGPAIQPSKVWARSAVDCSWALAAGTVQAAHATPSAQDLPWRELPVLDHTQAIHITRQSPSLGRPALGTVRVYAVINLAAAQAPPPRARSFCC